METPDIPPTGVLLDLDGTLVDSVYPHVIAWHEALAAAGHTVAMSAIHSGIGMGSDRLLPWLLGGHVDGAQAISDDHKQRFLDRAGSLAPTAGANALLDDLERRGVPFLISTSAGTDEREALLAALGRDDLPITGADDVASSKPAPDLLVAARAQLEGEFSSVIMVGDAPWDALAATRAGMDAVAVRCGGFGDDTLRGAGATRVVDAPRDLIGTL
jgi:phosphoglycolate phosphatase-like HAD superfamily hydrolase